MKKPCLVLFFLPPIIVIKSSSKSNLRERGLTLFSSRYSLSWSQSQDGRRLKLLIPHIHVKSREWRLLLPSDPLTLHMLPPTLRVGLPPQPHERSSSQAFLQSLQNFLLRRWGWGGVLGCLSLLSFLYVWGGRRTPLGVGPSLPLVWGMFCCLPLCTQS